MPLLKLIGSVITFIVFLTIAYLILSVSAIIEFIKGIVRSLI